MILRIAVFFILCVLTVTLSRAADDTQVTAAQEQGDSYAQPTVTNLVQTLIRFNAINIKDPEILDEYAMITDCDIVKYFYDNDFRWNRVREAITESIDINIATFPTSYHRDAQLQLDRYDFPSKLFRFTDKTAVNRVNAFVLYKKDSISCGEKKIRLLPVTYRAVIDTPITIQGLPFAEADAKALLRRMGESGNDDRIVYTRFNLRIVYIEGLRKSQLPSEQGEVYQQPDNANGDRAVRLDARLDSVDFYEDEEMTKLIYSYRT